MKTSTARALSLSFAAATVAAIVDVGAVRSISAPAPELPAVRLPLKGNEFALDLATGNLAAVSSEEKQVNLYASALNGADPLKPAATAELETEPQEIVFKQTPGGSFFVVRAERDPHLYVFNAATLKQTAKIALPDFVTAVGASASPADPYVYCTYGAVPRHIGDRVDPEKCGLSRIDAARGVHERIFTEPARGCVVSSQGGILYIRHNYFAEAHRIVPATQPGLPPTLKRLATLAYSGNTIPNISKPVPDLMEFCTAYGGEIRSPGLDVLFAKADFEPAGYFAKRPIVVGLKAAENLLTGYVRDDTEPAELIVASSNTYEVIERAKLPMEMFPDHNDDEFTGKHADDLEFDFYRNGPRVFVDEPRGRIVVANSNRVVAAPLSGFSLKTEPQLILYGDTAAPLAPGAPQVVRLAASDPKITLELLEPLGDAKVTAKGLEWTPGQEDVGPNVFMFRLKLGELQRTVPMTVNVERPRIALPFDLRRYVFSDDGKSLFLFVGGPAANEPPRNEQGLLRGAVLDLTGAKSPVTADLALKIRQAEIDAHFVYAFQSKSKDVVVLDRGTLAEKQKITLADEVRWIKAAANKTLAVGVEDGRWYTYAVPGLTLVAEHKMTDVRFSEFRSSDQPDPVTAIDGGLRLASGDVFDATLEKQMLFVSNPYFQSAFQAQFPSRRENVRVHTLEGKGLTPLPSYRASLPDQRFGMGAQILVRQPDQTLPAPVRDTRKWESWFVALYRPAAHLGRVYRLLPIVKFETPHQPYGYQQPRGGLEIAGDRLFMLTEKELFWIPLADLKDPSDPPLPLALAERQSTVALDAAGVTKLAHPAVGGRPPYQYTLPAPGPGLSIDAATGEVSVDGPALTAAAIDLNGGSLAGERPRAGAWRTSEELIGYWSEKGATFEKMVGRKAKGVPISVPIEVVVTDADQATARLRYYTVLEVPRKDLDDRIAKVAPEAQRIQQEQQAAIAAGRRAQMEGRFPQGMPGAPAPGGVSPQTQARVRQLNDRLGALESQLDALIQLLEAKAK